MHATLCCIRHARTCASLSAARAIHRRSFCHPFRPVPKSPLGAPKTSAMASPPPLPPETRRGCGSPRTETQPCQQYLVATAYLRRHQHRHVQIAAGRTPHAALRRSSTTAAAHRRSRLTVYCTHAHARLIRSPPSSSAAGFPLSSPLPPLAFGPLLSRGLDDLRGTVSEVGREDMLQIA